MSLMKLKKSPYDPEVVFLLSLANSSGSALGAATAAGACFSSLLIGVVFSSAVEGSVTAGITCFSLLTCSTFNCGLGGGTTSAACCSLSRSSTSCSVPGCCAASLSDSSVASSCNTFMNGSCRSGTDSTTLPSGKLWSAIWSMMLAGLLRRLSSGSRRGRDSNGMSFIAGICDRPKRGCLIIGIISIMDERGRASSGTILLPVASMHRPSSHAIFDCIWCSTKPSPTDEEWTSRTRLCTDPSSSLEKEISLEKEYEDICPRPVVAKQRKIVVEKRIMALQICVGRTEPE
mmetsp:Transcript_108161/g.187805  ORF Transcript_108161/g.187805 Transcript_108161/m.187805 type:complete len:289 (-) Transcript_108161:41-907(-)